MSVGALPHQPLELLLVAPFLTPRRHPQDLVTQPLLFQCSAYIPAQGDKFYGGRGTVEMTRLTFPGCGNTLWTGSSSSPFCGSQTGFRRDDAACLHPGSRARPGVDVADGSPGAPTEASPFLRHGWVVRPPQHPSQIYFLGLDRQTNPAVCSYVFSLHWCVSM